MSIDLIAIVDYIISTDDPLCVCRDDLDDIETKITGAKVTEYYRFVTRLIFPDTSSAQLKLISTHSLRVTTATSLH